MASTNFFPRIDASEILCHPEEYEAGSGGCNDVLVGFYLTLGIFVAVKVFPLAGGPSGRRLAKEKVNEEIGHLCKANHENIVRYHGLVEWPFTIGIVMEYCEGGNLEDLLLNHAVPLPIPLRIRMLLDIANALASCHSLEVKRLIHGDVTPRNGLITKELDCKLCDFGGAELSTLSTAVTMEALAQPRRSKKDRVQLTPLYTAPEKLQDPGMKPRKELDTYAFAMLMHMFLTRDNPYPCGDRTALLDAIKQGTRPNCHKIEELKETLNDNERRIVEELEQMMKECWDQDPSARPTMIEVSERLQQLLDQQNRDVLEQQVAEVIRQMDINPPFSVENLEQLVPIQHYSTRTRSFPEPEQNHSLGTHMSTHHVNGSPLSPSIPSLPENPPSHNDNDTTQRPLRNNQPSRFPPHRVLVVNGQSSNSNPLLNDGASVSQSSGGQTTNEGGTNQPVSTNSTPWDASSEGQSIADVTTSTNPGSEPVQNHSFGTRISAHDVIGGPSLSCFPLWMNESPFSFGNPMFSTSTHIDGPRRLLSDNQPSRFSADPDIIHIDTHQSLISNILLNDGASVSQSSGAQTTNEGGTNRPVSTNNAAWDTSSEGQSTADVTTSTNPGSVVGIFGDVRLSRTTDSIQSQGIYEMHEEQQVLVGEREPNLLENAPPDILPDNSFQTVSKLKEVPPKQQGKNMASLMQQYAEVLRKFDYKTADEIRHQVSELLKGFVPFATAESMQTTAKLNRDQRNHLVSLLFYDLASDAFSLHGNEQGVKGVRDCVSGVRQANAAMLETSNLAEKHDIAQIIKDYVIPLMQKMENKIQSMKKVDAEFACLQAVWCLNDIEWSQGIIADYASKEATLKRGLAKMENQFGADARKYHVYGLLLHNLGWVCERSDRLKESEDMYKQALSCYEMVTDLTQEEKDELEAASRTNLIRVRAKLRQ